MGRAVRLLSSAELATALRGGGGGRGGGAGGLTVVDVRDEDRAGGHIAGSVHAPSESFGASLDAYVGHWAGAERVVFHCMMSQVRAPSCAARFARRCDQLLGERTGPTVFVLDGGFAHFSSAHGHEKDLVEGHAGLGVR